MKKKNFNSQLLIRLSNDDLNKLKVNAQRERLPVSTYVRNQISKDL